MQFLRSKNIQEADFPTYRGGQDKDWVSEDDYDPNTPPNGGQHLKNPHRKSGYLARSQGQDRTKNPYPKHSKPHIDWHNGWDDHHFIHEPKNHEYGGADN